MLEQGQTVLSEEARLWFQAGLAACDLQDYERAIVHFDQVLQLDADCWQVWYERGAACEALSQYEAAISSYQTALRLNPPPSTLIEIWYHQADILHYGLSQYEQAIAAYNQVLRHDAAHALAWFHRGNAQFYGLQQTQDALVSYNHALALDPDCDLLWRNRGNALRELGHEHAALLNYDRAIALNPNDTASWQVKATLLEALGDTNPPAIPSVNSRELGYWETLAAIPTAPQENLDDDEPCITFATLIQRAPQASSSTAILQPSPSQSTLRIPLLDGVLGITPMVLIQDSRGRRQVELNRSSYSIGRDPSNDIQLYSKFASRHHAMLLMLPAPLDTPSSKTPIYQIRDGDSQGNRSTNGLLINGRKCRDWTLRHGDKVLFGPNVWLQYLLLSRNKPYGGFSE